jgi:hypothetical protein
MRNRAAVHGEDAVSDESKERSELIRELEEFRSRVALLQARQPLENSNVRAHDYPASERSEPLSSDAFHELDQPPRPLRVPHESTQSIDLGTLLTRDVTLSGSFDIRGDIWATTFGKVIQALPIPALLVDQSLKVVVLNQACGKFATDTDRILGQPFAALVGGTSSQQVVQTLLERVFSDRRARLGEGMLQIQGAMIWARLTFRSIRVMSERFILILVEDLTRERLQLRENEVLRQELEQRVEQRTAELRRINEELTREVADRIRAEQQREEVIDALKLALVHVKRLSGLLPICASCKRIRDDQGYWQQLEAYLSEHTEAQFSHGICPDCAKRLYPDFFPRAGT